jgi:hypothetical protein
VSDVRISTVGPWASAVVTVYFDHDPDSAVDVLHRVHGTCRGRGICLTGPARSVVGFPTPGIVHCTNVCLPSAQGAGSRRAIDETAPSDEEGQCSTEPGSSLDEMLMSHAIAQDLDRRLVRASRAAAFVWPQTDLVLNLGM